MAEGCAPHLNLEHLGGARFRLTKCRDSDFSADQITSLERDIDGMVVVVAAGEVADEVHEIVKTAAAGFEPVQPHRSSTGSPRPAHEPNAAPDTNLETPMHQSDPEQLPPDGATVDSVNEHNHLAGLLELTEQFFRQASP